MGEPTSGERRQRIIFEDANGQISWFSTDQIEFERKYLTTDVVDEYLPQKCGIFGVSHHLALLAGNKWVLYDPRSPNHSGLATVRLVTEQEALDWLLLRNFEPPACLVYALNERCVVKQSDLAENHRFKDNLSSRPASTGAEGTANEYCEASDNLRNTYRDPDNYWRNVWLYEQRKAGKTNPAILAELADRAHEFAPLESENALREAIATIGEFHRWPTIRGKPGRPKTK